MTPAQTLAHDVAAIGIIGCVGKFLAAIHLAHPRVDAIEFETPFAPADRVKLTCTLDEIFAVIQTTSGSFVSAVITGISICATEHPRFEFSVASVNTHEHLSKSSSRLAPAVSTSVFSKDTSTTQPFVSLRFESKRSNLKLSQSVAFKSQNSSVSDGPTITSELTLAKFLEWKDSESLNVLEQQENAEFPDVAVFSVVGAVCGARINLDLDNLFQIAFFRSLAFDVLQILSCLKEAGFTVDGLFSSRVHLSSPYHAFCSHMSSHPFVMSPPQLTSPTERSASQHPLKSEHICCIIFSGEGWPLPHLFSLNPDASSRF